MQKKNFLNNLTTVMLLLASFTMVSCNDVIDAIFSKEDNTIGKTVAEAIVEKTGSSAAEVTSLLNAAMATPEVQKAIDNNESFSVNVAVAGGSSAAGETITIPVSGGEGKNGANVTINFTNAVTGTSETKPLNFTAANASSAGAGATGSGNSDNQLTINMPSGSTGLVITIDLPDTTVKLTTDGSGSVVYKSISARTALNTLIIDKGVTVEDLNPLGGSILVLEGGKINRMVFAPTVYPGKEYYTHNQLTIWPDGAMGVPIMKREGVDFGDPDNWTTNAVRYDGEWVKFDHLKVIPGNFPYLELQTYGNPPTLKTLTIADNAAIFFAENFWGGEGLLPMEYRKLKTEIIGEGSNATYFYSPEMEIAGYKSMTKVNIKPRPNFGFDPNDGNPHFALRNMRNGVENCNIYMDHCVWEPEYLIENRNIIVKNCNFKVLEEELPMDQGGTRITTVLPPTPEGANPFELSFTFEGCNFDEGIFLEMGGIDNKDLFSNTTVTYKFIGCKYNGSPLTIETTGFLSIDRLDNLGNNNNHVYFIIGTSEDSSTIYECTYDPIFPDDWDWDNQDWSKVEWVKVLKEVTE